LFTDRTRARDYFAEYRAAVEAYGRELEKAFGFTFLPEHDDKGKEATPGSALPQAYDAMVEAERAGRAAPARNMDRITKNRLSSSATLERHRVIVVAFTAAMLVGAVPQIALKRAVECGSDPAARACRS
jgi:hypothetical protein